MKKCSKCKQEKEYSEFAKDNRTLDRLYFCCKKCTAKLMKDYRNKKSEGTIKAF